jgi:hypothetical protein
MYIEKDLIEVVGRKMDGPNLQFAKGTKALLKAPPDFSRESSKGIYEPVRILLYAIYYYKLYKIAFYIEGD